MQYIQSAFGCVLEDKHYSLIYLPSSSSRVTDGLSNHVIYLQLFSKKAKENNLIQDSIDE